MSLIHSFQEGLTVLQAFIDDSSNIETTHKIAEQLAVSFANGNKILACGNGGSACDAMHLCEEFTGRYRANRRALPAIALTDASHITCVANDFGFDEVFARGVEAFAQSGDWLFALSTSGNSANIIRALEVARERGMVTVGLLGKSGGKMKGTCDYEYVIPALTSDRIQELHMMILHIIIEGVERRLFPENY